MREWGVRGAKREQKGLMNLALAPLGPILSPPGYQEESESWDKLKPSLGGVVGRDNTSLGLCFSISERSGRSFNARHLIS